MKRFFFIFLALLFFTCSFIANAGYSLTFSNPPKSLNEDEEFEIDVSFVGESKTYASKKYFLRAVFSEKDSTKYFGYTHNGKESWGNSGSDKSLLLEITTNDEASWSGKLKVKPDVTSSNFSGEGTYFLKVGRYTSQNDSSADWTDQEEEVFISYTAPSPTATPTSNPTSTPQPTQVQEPTPTKVEIDEEYQTAEEITYVEKLNADENATPSAIRQTFKAVGLYDFSSSKEATVAGAHTSSDAGAEEYSFPLLLMVGGVGLVGFGLWPYMRELFV